MKTTYIAPRGQETAVEVAPRGLASISDADLYNRSAGLLDELIDRRVQAALRAWQPPPIEQALRAPEAAAKLGVTEDWLRRHQESFPFFVRVGGQPRFSSAGIDRWIRAHESR